MAMACFYVAARRWVMAQSIARLPRLLLASVHSEVLSNGAGALVPVRTFAEQRGVHPLPFKMPVLAYR
ncbi:hypothetical protein EJ03DRAFT_161064 [Teratosphaeria nubilosa]|uniref:Uncharacterized protein n=1 Tax=Teratosphaeria nubilosa TaxID=161662 RepID=A0A6G1L2M6_9PEZI|nr:hypothetical protein EJ03DRAFT_161064 [Teratosphaeria nubilosa]